MDSTRKYHVTRYVTQKHEKQGKTVTYLALDSKPQIPLKYGAKGMVCVTLERAYGSEGWTFSTGRINIYFCPPIR